MAVLETLPSVNLKWDDIRDTLNAGGGSVTNVVSTAFLEKNINIFSFYKPHHGIYDFPPSVPYTDAKGGLYLDEVNHVIKWNAPKGGSGSPYRLSDFCGYKYKSLPPSVDGTQLRATADMTSVSFDVTIEPTWGDSKFDWGLVCGGFTFANMQIKCEVYNQDKKLIGSSSFKVSDIKSTGRVTMTLNRNNQIDRTDTKIYVKGYFCDYDGNVLCPIPTTTDGFVEKPLTVTQSVYLYAGAVTINNTSFAAKIRMLEGEGAWVSNMVVDITNNGTSDYVAGTGFPQAQWRWRAVDGSYTGSWQGGGRINECTNIPRYITRTGYVDPGKWPTYGSVTKWYIDINIKMN